MSKITSKPCPQCGKPVVHQFRPFCSQRCKMIDLGNWASGAYVIPGRDGNAINENGELPEVDEE